MRSKKVYTLVLLVAFTIVLPLLSADAAPLNSGDIIGFGDVYESESNYGPRLFRLLFDGTVETLLSLPGSNTGETSIDDITIDPVGNIFLLISSPYQDTLPAILKFDPGTGTETPVVPHVTTGAFGGFAMAQDPNSGFLFVVRRAINPEAVLYQVEPATGSITPLLPEDFYGSLSLTSFWPYGITVDQQGRLFLLGELTRSGGPANIREYGIIEVARVPGASSRVIPLGPDTGMGGGNTSFDDIVAHPNGKIYAPGSHKTDELSGFDGAVIEINPEDGNQRIIFLEAGQHEPCAFGPIAIDTNGDVLVDGRDVICRVNLSSGAQSRVLDYSSSAEMDIDIFGIAVMPSVGVAPQPRPIPLGVLGGNVVQDTTTQRCCSGTLGALVEKQLEIGPRFFILSNNHVLARYNAGSVGERIVQPPSCPLISRTDIVASLSYTVPIDFSAGAINMVDAALALVEPGQVDTQGTILDIGVPAGTPLAPSPGMKVKKRGGVTGLTHGTIAAVGRTLTINTPMSCGSTQTTPVRYVNQIIISPPAFAAPGDSGSLIVEDVAANPRPIGLLFGGDPTLGVYANVITDVLAALGGAKIVGTMTTAAEEGHFRETSTMDSEVATMFGVLDRHEEVLQQIPGVVGWGVGLAAPDSTALVLQVYLEHLTPEQEKAIPATLDSFPVTKVVTGRLTTW